MATFKRKIQVLEVCAMKGFHESSQRDKLTVWLRWFIAFFASSTLSDSFAVIAEKKHEAVVAARLQ